ncbi:MAG TPA: hypothetical protein VF216_07520 [Mizugakiibacter sp.]
MTFARRVFFIAGLYGLLTLLPDYFLEARIGRDAPPPITHPEFYYGFVGIALAWQLLFFVIARDPVRYRMAMLPAALEKLVFAAAVLALYAQQRVAARLLPFAVIDVVLCALFLGAWWRIPSRS